MIYKTKRLNSSNYELNQQWIQRFDRDQDEDIPTTTFAANLFGTLGGEGGRHGLVPNSKIAWNSGGRLLQGSVGENTAFEFFRKLIVLPDMAIWFNLIRNCTKVKVFFCKWSDITDGHISDLSMMLNLWYLLNVYQQRKVYWNWLIIKSLPSKVIY